MEFPSLAAPEVVKKDTKLSKWQLPVQPMRKMSSSWYLYQLNENNLNPLRAKLLRENINIYLHFLSFLHTNKTQVVDIPSRVRQGPVYST